MSQRILGFPEFIRFDEERRQAFLTFDKRTIKRFYRRWNIPYPKDDREFWTNIVNAVGCMHDVPEGTMQKAAAVLEKSMN